MTASLPRTRNTVDWKAVGIFVLISYGLAFIIDAVVLTTMGLANPLAIVPISLRMFTPLIATVIICRWVTREKWLPAVGLSRESFAQGQWKKIITSSLLGLVLIAVVIAASTAVAIAAGWLEPDWSMSQTLAPLADAGVTISPGVLLLITVIQALFASVTINAVMTFGEEAGWRGWLQQALEPLGRLRQILLTGAIWGLWHTPLIAAGYNFENQIPGIAAVVLFTVFCIAFGALLSWLSIRSHSVLPAVIGHAFFNAMAAAPALLIAPGDTWDRVLAAPMGVPGIVLFAALAVVLFYGFNTTRKHAVAQHN